MTKLVVKLIEHIEERTDNPRDLIAGFVLVLIGFFLLIKVYLLVLWDLGMVG